MNASATPRLAAPLTALCLALLAVVPPAQAAPAGTSLATDDCSGDVHVQHQVVNDHSCEDCRGSVIVQVGLSNRVECEGSDCSGNVVVQVGLDNSLDCGNGLGHEVAGVPRAGPCPPPLPEGNFYCHVLGRVLPAELCFTLDFCLW